MEKNLTTGSVFKNVVLFSLPYLLSYFLQTLYGMADLFIIGQFEGVASTTAVSIGSQVMHMLTVMIVGLSMGTTVSVGQAVGAGDRKQAAHNIGNTVILFLVVSIALTAILLSLVHPIVVAMSAPADAVSGTDERYFYERKTGIAADFIHDPAYGFIHAGQFPIQHCGQFFRRADQRGGYDGIIAGLPGSKFYQCCRNWIWRWHQCSDLLLSGRGGSQKSGSGSHAGTCDCRDSWHCYDSLLYYDHAGFFRNVHFIQDSD